MLKENRAASRNAMMKGIDVIEAKMMNEFEFELDIEGDAAFKKACVGVGVKKKLFNPYESQEGEVMNDEKSFDIENANITARKSFIDTD